MSRRNIFNKERKMGLFQYCFIFAVCLHVSYSQVTKGFNSAIGSSISANITCGAPPEQFYNTKQGYVSPRNRVISLCNASIPLYSHPAKNMIDGQFNTFWQSANNESNAFITINLHKALLGKGISFTFGDYRRPGQIAIYRSSDFGRTYTPWHYLVSTKTQCTSVFNIPTNLIFSYPDRINRTVCAEYSFPYPLEFDEMVNIDLNGNQRGDGSANYDSPQLRAWMNVTNVHIRFTGLYRKFDFIDTRWHHYAVREIKVMAVCDCNGHGNGEVCPVNAQTGQRQCQCADNTCGSDCDRCCPGFHQYPWKRGTSASWLSDPKTACEKCNCFNHTNQCVYNATVDALRLSLNAKGNYSGGGSCLGCQHNTEGVNCEKCQKFFYRPVGKARNLTDSCSACGCFQNGTKIQPGFDFLECIRDEETAKLHIGKTSGDCFCKSFVTGRTCSSCKNEYYRLEGTNAQGCLACNCFLPGTVGRNAVCNKDFFGQCACKSNVQLRDCSQCKDGYYGMTDPDINGCKACVCDVGASRNAICHKTTGQCSCRSFLHGRTCSSVLIGYYYSTVHFISGSRNMYTSATFSLQTSIYVPKTTIYRIYVAYTMAKITNVRLTLRLQKLSVTLSSSSLPITVATYCNQLCYKVFYVANKLDFSLEIGTWNVNITSASAESQLKIEKVIVVPQLFLTASILSTINRNWFLANCNVTSNNMGTGTSNEQRCLSYVYSLTTFFNNGALPCKCHVVGSKNSTCQQYGGQCFCKSGVGERDCSRCLPGYYNFSSTGCTPCGCKGPNKVCDPVTGLCECPANTIGRICDPCSCNSNSNQCLRNGDCVNCENNSTSKRCEICKSGFFGSAVNQNCQPCSCHVHGSRNQTCDAASGQCYCKDGVVGIKCNSCLPNYYGLVTSGCFPCNCNSLGSIGQPCASSGQCTCVERASGLRCDTCKPGFYGLPTKTCQPCNCDAKGTLSGTFCLNDVTGQCRCKPGVTGRTCNQCARQYVNFTNAGCEQCPLCTRNMQTSIDLLKAQLAVTQLRVNETKNMTYMQAEIVRIQNKANSLQVSAVLHDQRVQKGQTDYSFLTRTYLTPLTQRHSTLTASISRVSTQASSLISVGTSNAAKMQQIEQSATTASALSTSASSIASSVFMSLADVTKLSSTQVAKTQLQIQQISLALHQFMLTSITADLALSNAVSQNVSKAGQSVQSQQSLSSSITSTVQSSKTTFTQWNTTWRQQLPQFLLDIQNVYKKGLDVMALLNSTKSLIVQQDKYIKDTNATHKQVQIILQEATTVYQQGLAAYEQSKIHTTSVTGTLQVAILQFISNTLTVKVLRGSNLAARDFPSLLSDPYFLISIVPDWGQVGSKKSPVVNATLNPSWPTGDSYSFTLTPIQLQQSSLFIQIFDSDPIDADDFIGEVVINVGAIPGILTATVTQTYPVRIQGYASTWSSSFAAKQNTIADVQKVLSSQISTVTTLMTQAEAVATQAETAAISLQTQATVLTTTFATAKTYASAAVNAVNTYREIYRLINDSLIAANAANKSAAQITSLMQNLSLTKIQTKADAAIAESQLLLAVTKARNITFPKCQFYLRSETLGSAGISNPPRSRIEIDGIDYSKHLDGYNVVVADLKTGVVESSVNFRVDIDANAGKKMADFLAAISGQKIVAIVKQGQGDISLQYRVTVLGELIALGAQPPYLSGQKGSYALLGYKRIAGQVIPWTKQVLKIEGQGISEITGNVPLFGSLNDLVNAANTTFQSVWPQWQEIDRQFTVLKTKTQQLLLTESVATIVQASLQAANLILNQATESATRVLSETVSLQTNVKDITTKYYQIVYLVGNSSSLISNASSTVAQAETRLPLQSNIVLSAKTTSRQINSTIKSMDAKVLSIEAKLATLKSFASQIPFAIHFQTIGSAVYLLQGYSSTMSKVLYNSIGFDMKANSTNGIVLYMLSQPGKLPYSIGLYLQNGYLYLIYHLGFGQTVVRNGMRIELNQWYYVYFARQGKDGLLSVRSSNGATLVARATSVYSGDSLTMDFSSNSRVYLGGFAAGFMASLVTLYGQYSGTIDNMVINNIQYNMWSYMSTTGMLTYAGTRYGFRPTTDGSWISFYGNGFLRHSVGSFQINSAYSEIQLEFRTLRDNTVILGVTDAAGNFVYGLYLVAGKLLFQFSTGVGQNAALLTARNTYVSGRWYKVRMIRTSINATLSITLVGSTNAADTETITTYAQTVVPQGYLIIFGAPSTSSTINPPVTGIYAGDIRYLFLTNSLTNQLQSRSFNFSTKVSEKGVSYYGMVNAKVVSGIRFYGYMWWLGFGSYSTLLSGANGLIKSLSFVFKTTQMTGLIMYSNDNNQYLNNQGLRIYFYMALFGGNLVLTHHDNNFATLAPYLSKNLTLSDGKWHNVTLLYLETSFNYLLRIDGRVVYTGWFGNFKREIAASSPFYFGGIPSAVSIPFAVPTITSLAMDVQNLFINYRMQNLHQSISYGVSYAGVVPSSFAPQPPTPAPTCGTSFPTLLYSATANEVQFGSHPWASTQTYVGFQLTADQKAFFKRSFVVTLEFKATGKDGVIFYIADSSANATQYVSLEMVNGKLQFKFSAGEGIFTVTTTRDYSQDAKWNLIHLLRINQFVALLLPESKEYQHAFNSNAGKDFVVGTPVYLGGLANSVVAAQFVNRNVGFTGCLRRFEVASDMRFFSLHLAAPQLGGAVTGTSPCYSNVETGAYFNSSSWIYYDNNFQFGENFTVLFSFRTDKRSGLFFYLFSNDTAKGADVNTTSAKYMIFEMTEGKIDLHYKPDLNRPAEIISWIDPSSNFSHLICDQQWHKAQITKNGFSFTISVDNFVTTKQATQRGSISGNLYIGGLPNGISKPGHTTKTFNGCFKSLTFNNKNMMNKAKAGENVRFGCPKI